MKGTSSKQASLNKNNTSCKKDNLKAKYPMEKIISVVYAKKFLTYGSLRTHKLEVNETR